MAITKDVVIKGTGVEVLGAYIAVFRPTISADKKRLGFNIQTRYAKSSEDFLTDTHEMCDYDMDGPNVFIQIYTHLKTLEEFEGATDC